MSKGLYVVEIMKSFSNDKEIIHIILGESGLATLWWLDLCPVFGI